MIGNDYSRAAGARVLDPMEIRELSRTSNLMGALYLAKDWLVIAIAATAAIYSRNFLVYLTAILVIGRQQHAFVVLLHEAVHYRMFANRTWNDLLGHLFAGAPIFFSLASFRFLHFRHHQSPMSADDPDLVLTGGYPISRESLGRKLVRDLTGRTYYKFVRSFNQYPPGRAARAELGPLSVPGVVNWSYLAAQVAIFALMYRMGTPWDYLLLWLLPMNTLLPAMLRLRGVVEHAGYGESKDQSLNTRTVVSRLGNLILAPNFVYYHTEHHLYPSVPCYHLARLHSLMRGRGGAELPTFFRSYRQVFKQLVTRRKT
jgi:fatty acid desaturase